METSVYKNQLYLLQIVAPVVADVAVLNFCPQNSSPALGTTAPRVAFLDAIGMITQSYLEWPEKFKILLIFFSKNVEKIVEMIKIK